MPKFRLIIEKKITTEAYVWARDKEEAEQLWVDGDYETELEIDCKNENLLGIEEAE